MTNNEIILLNLQKKREQLLKSAQLKFITETSISILRLQVLQNQFCYSAMLNSNYKLNDR